MRFRAQLAVGYTALLVVTFATGVAAMAALRTTSERLEHVGDQVGAELLAIEHLRFEAEETVSANRGDLLAGGDPAAERFSQAAATFEADLAHPGRLDVRDVAEAASNYLSAAREAERRRAAATDPTQVIPFYVQIVVPAQRRLELALTALESHEREAFADATHDARRFAGHTQGLVAAATLVAAVLGIALASLSARRLAAQYAREQDATAAARRAIAERDELAAVVSHDLRNPLMTIALGADLLASAETDLRLRKHVGSIGEAAKCMQGLIDELLDVTRLERGRVELHPEPVRVGALFETIEALFLARATDAGVELVAGPGEELAVHADRDRLVQVLSNLVGNALKYTPKGGKIALAARSEQGRVRVEVTDTGSGIAPAQRAHVFDRYWQDRPRGRGSLGLGLYICKRLIEAHRGEIGVDSEPGKGSTFWFTLPAATPAAPA